MNKKILKSIRLNSEVVTKINSEIDNLNLNFSEIINSILYLYFFDNNKNEYMDFNNSDNKNIKEIRINLNKNEYSFLFKQAKLHGFNSVTKEVKFRLVNTIYNDKFFTNIEMNELAKLLNDLNKMGRNINELVRILREKKPNEFTIKFENLQNSFNEINKNIKEINNEIQSYKIRLDLRV